MAEAVYTGGWLFEYIPVKITQINTPKIFREQVCGKPNCKFRKGYKHVYLFLVRSYDGMIRQYYFQKEKEEFVHEWVKTTL